MSWTNINNEESGSSIRTKINNAMNALFGALPVPEFWETVPGQTSIRPKDSKNILTPEILATTKVETTLVEAANLHVADDAIFDDLTFTGDPSDRRPVVSGPDGKLHKGAFEDFGGAFTGRGSDIVTGTDKNIILSKPNVFVRTFDDDCDLILPSAATSLNAEINVVKMRDNANEARIFPDGSDAIFFADASGNGLITTELDAWVRLKCVGGGEWYVMSHGGTWSITT